MKGKIYELDDNIRDIQRNWREKKKMLDGMENVMHTLTEPMDDSQE